FLARFLRSKKPVMLLPFCTVIWLYIMYSHLYRTFARGTTFFHRCGLAVFSAAPPLIHRFCG
ncbi:hypothetical protein, partial [Klebsiella grimontii]|uniref:hypothetical protein n=1 Tax=Klebsiella grimontii TaxID=2058152 RepID=UPI001F154AEB